MKPAGLVLSVPERLTVALQIVHRLFHYLDEGRFEALAALFSPGGVWVRQGQDLVGHDAILQAMRARPADLTTRHLVTNLWVPDATDSIQTRYCVTVYDHVGTREGPAPLAIPHAIFTCEDELIPGPHGWLFARRSPRPVFRRE